LSDPKPSSPPSPSKPAWPDYRPLARLAMASGHLPPDAGIYAMENSFKPDTRLPRDLAASRRERTGSQVSGDERTRRLGKDEKLAKEAGIKFNVKKTLVGLPMDEFNDLLSKNEMSEEQLNICRDIRRRGKNKVAAQNCRQRKIEQVEELQGKLSVSMARRDRARYEHQRLLSMYSAEADKLKTLTDIVLSHHSKDSSAWSLQVEGEEVKVMPKTEVKEEDMLNQPVGSYPMSPASWNTYPSNMGTNYQEHNNQTYQRKHFN